MTIAATPLSIGFEECGLEALKELAGLKLRLFARPCLRAVSEAYDAQNDFLTQVDYNDGQANEVQNWDYDAAGNRGSYISNIPGAQWTYDNLNRIVTSPIGSYAHDMAGNRLTGPGQTLSWDVTNRLTGLNGVTHRYRNDGMRVQKVAANGDTYRWHYDAQMPVEETRVVGGQTTVMRNIVGPRGIDIQFDGSNAAFPLYDTHGNAQALLARSGSTFSTTAWRHYDVWGSLRAGSALGGASQRYCANLGHVTDDESGLIYMRARFYEPWTGRFVSEDPGTDGSNWFIYSRNCPTELVDKSGLDAITTMIQIFCFLMGEILMGMAADSLASRIANLSRWVNQLKALTSAGIECAGNLNEIVAMERELAEHAKKLNAAKGVAKAAGTAKTIAAVAGYALIIKAFLMDIDYLGNGRTGIDILMGN